MTKLVIGSVANHPFAVRADRVEKTVEIQSFSRFLRGKRDDVVAAVIEDRVHFLTDLSVRLGLNGLSQTGRAGLITAPDQQISGVLAQDPPTTINVEDASVLPVSSYIGSSVMEACALIGDQFVPVLSEEFFTELQQSDKVHAWSPVEHPAGEGGGTGGFFGVRIGQFHCAFAIGGFGEAEEIPPIVPLPYAPERIVGLARLKDEMAAVANVGAALALDRQADAATVVPYERGEVAAYFLVSEYQGSATGRELTLPKLLRRPGMGCALDVGNELRPIIDPAAVLGSVPEESTIHETDSTFQEALYHRSVSVMEFSFGDFIYAVPTEEVRDEVEELRSYPFWANHPLIKRVAGSGDTLLPELDLAGYLGHDSDEAQSKPLYVRNGEFEAVFAAEALMGKRVLEPHEQKPLPTELPHNLVYGCYLDGREVRLILNLAAIAEHATDERLQNVLASISNASRVSLAARHSRKATFTPAPPPAEVETEETTAEAEVDNRTEPNHEPVQPAAETEPVAPEDYEEDDVQPAETMGPDETDSDETNADVSEADLDGSETPDIELDLEHEPFDGQEVDEEDPTDGAIDLEIEPPLTIDPEMASWQSEQDDGEPRPAEAPARGGEMPAETATAAIDPLREAPEPTTLSHTGDQAEESPEQKRHRGRAVLLILLLAVVAVVGSVYLFQRSLFDRLLAQAQETATAVITSVGQVEDPIEGASASEDEVVAETTGNPPADAPADAPAGDPASAQSTGTPDATTQAGFAERIYFAADSAELLPDARETLNGIVERVNRGERWSIEIVGHVARAQHGTPESFRWLSEQRAIAVRDYLLPRLDAPPLELKITGRGASEPAAPNATASGRALNRRVQVIVEAAE